MRKIVYQIEQLGPATNPSPRVGHEIVNISVCRTLELEGLSRERGLACGEQSAPILECCATIEMLHNANRPCAATCYMNRGC